MVPKLSILIPTFNRVNDLRRLLPLLVEAKRDYPDVEVVISNNASVDGTRAVLDSVDPSPGFRIVHQPINYGFSLHLAWLYGQASGEFLWLFGDDDVFLPGAVQKILSTLEEHPGLGWIHLPHAYLKTIEPEVVHAYSARPEQNSFYPEGRRLVADYAQWTTFISANVMRSELIQTRLKKLTFETLYWPFELLAAATADSPAAVLAGLWVKGGPDITWKDSANVVSNVHLPKAVLALDNFSRNERKAAMEHIFRVEPDRLERLLVLSPQVFARVVWLCPGLLARFGSLGFLSKMAKGSAWRRFFGRTTKAD